MVAHDKTRLIGWLPNKEPLVRGVFCLAAAAIIIPKGKPKGFLFVSRE